jgi:hypothetical protein
VEAPAFCKGCGRAAEVSADDHPCGRGGADDETRFCPRCGWRLRDIAVVPGMGGRWCRVHGVVTDPD